MGPDEDLNSVSDRLVVPVSPLSPLTATGMLLLYATIYVLPLYASRATRPSSTLSRDSSRVIRARIKSATLSTILCSLFTYVLLSSHAHSTSLLPLHYMGYWPLGIGDALKSLALTAILFAGSLLECLLFHGGWDDWVRFRPLYRVWTELTNWRNIVIGPLTEEALFRSAAVPLLVLAGMRLGNIIFMTPFIFGLAHVHHFYEFRVTHPQVPVAAAVARSALQLSYTSLFGAYATFLFLRTGSFLAVFLVHAFCNSMGLPRFWGFVQPYWLYQNTAQTLIAVQRWTAVYYTLLVVGLITWWALLWKLTESNSPLAVF